MNAKKSASPIRLACHAQFERCSTLETTRRMQ
jgi:hypothetical protein